MRFQIERTYLTSHSGRSVSPDVAPNVSFHVAEASSLDEALLHFLREDRAQLVGEVLRFPGENAVATAKKNQNFYMVQLFPAEDVVLEIPTYVE